MLFPVSPKLHAAFLFCLGLSLSGCWGLEDGEPEQINAEPTVASGAIIRTNTNNTPLETVNNTTNITLPTAKTNTQPMLAWEAPNTRMNGDYLELNEIGGYEIRYQLPTSDEFNYITINDGSTSEYPLIDIPTSAHFEIAVFDTDGLYSSYAPIYPR